jgi:hypothetical protein
MKLMNEKIILMCSKYFGNVGKCFSCKLHHTYITYNGNESIQLLKRQRFPIIIANWFFSLSQLLNTVKPV